MKQKSILKLLSAAVTTAMVASAMMVPVWADPDEEPVTEQPTRVGTDYNTVQAQDAKFKKYLVIDEDANVPAVTFSYSVESGEAILPGTADTLPVYAGLGEPSIAQVVYEGTETTESSNLSIADKKVFEKEITIDFDGVEFDEPGVYRYIITEKTDAGAGIFYDVAADALTTDGDCKRTLDVYVEDISGETKELKISAYIMYDGEINVAPPAVAPGESYTSPTIEDEYTIPAVDVNEYNTAIVADGVKSDNYINYYTSASLVFGKEVKGNQGSKDKYFAITVKLTSPVNVTLPVDLTKADTQLPSADDLNAATDASFAGKENPDSIELTANEKKTVTFYLQDGQYVEISGIVPGLTYELDETLDGYTKAVGIEADDSGFDWDSEHDGADELKDAANGTFTADEQTKLIADKHTGFTNTKQGIIPTGVLLKATPVIVVGLVILAGAAFFMVKNVRRKVAEAGEAEESEE